MKGLLLALLLAQINSFKDAETRYGKLNSDYSWSNRSKWLIKFPFNKYINNAPVGYVNKDIYHSLLKVFEELKSTGLLKEITVFKGCYSPRAARGHSRPSIHAYGLGCDFDNKQYSEEFLRVWKSNNFCWGGDFSNHFDGMHFSWKGIEC